MIDLLTPESINQGFIWGYAVFVVIWLLLIMRRYRNCHTYHRTKTMIQLGIYYSFYGLIWLIPHQLWL
ncbi:MAG: hypothetical protein VXW65_09930, partial [Pseudomonadota bacterium]|nr:hypothetical protein [Pseudomonadota bacterium]